MGTLNAINQTPLSPGSSPDSGAGFGPSQLAGGPNPGPGDPSANPGSDPNSQSNALQTVVEQVRTMEQGVLGLAQQFPTAAPECRRAVDAIRAVLQRIVSTPSQTEPPSPVSLA